MVNLTHPSGDLTPLNREFWAKLTAYDGSKYYSWTEQIPVAPTTFVALDGPRSGTASQNPAYEANGATLTIPSFVKVQRAYFDATKDWVYVIVGVVGSAGASSLTVEDISEGPDITGVTEITVDSTTGQQLSGGSGVAHLVNLPASDTQIGTVNLTLDQKLGHGRKIVDQLGLPPIRYPGTAPYVNLKAVPAGPTGVTYLTWRNYFPGGFENTNCYLACPTIVFSGDPELSFPNSAIGGSLLQVTITLGVDQFSVAGYYSTLSPWGPDDPDSVWQVAGRIAAQEGYLVAHVGGGTSTGQTVTVSYVKSVDFVHSTVTTGTLTFEGGILTGST